MTRRKIPNRRKRAWAPRDAAVQSSRVARLIEPPKPDNGEPPSVEVAVPTPLEPFPPASSRPAPEARSASASVAEFLSRWHTRSAHRRAATTRRPHEPPLRRYSATARRLISDGILGTRRRRIAVGCAAGLLLFVSLAVWLTLRTPAWYVVTPVPLARQQAVRDDLEQMTDAFSMALVKPNIFFIELKQTQLTDWLDIRRRIWPAAEREIPPEWGGPLIRFSPGEVSIAAQYKGMAGHPIVSVHLAIAMQDDAIMVRPTGVNVGSLPVPLSWLSRWTKQLRIAARADESGVSISGNIVDGFRIGNRHTWWNGARDFRIRDVQISEGQISLEIEPLGPHPRRRLARGG